MAIKLHTCIVSRRGKAAKGTVQIQTFGIPILNEDKIAKEWDYSKLRDLYTERDTLDAIRKIGNSVEIMLRGADIFMKSEGIRSQGDTAMLVTRIIAEGLAMDKQEAHSVAIAILDSRMKLKKLGIDEEMIPTIEAMLKSRKKVVDKLKAEGNWKSKEPRLVKKNTKPINTDDLTDEESEDESDETEDTIEESEDDSDDSIDEETDEENN